MLVLFVRKSFTDGSNLCLYLYLPFLIHTLSLPPSEVKAWDVLTELVEVCAAPCPPNPFAVDMDYFRSLPLQETALASAAMISFLQRVIASGHHSYNRRSKSL